MTSGTAGISARDAIGPAWIEQAAVAAALAALASCYVILDLGRTHDDPFIIYRYAQNLLDGHGWTYNIGGGTANAATSTGYVLLVAAVGSLGVSLPAAGDMLFIVGMWTAGWMTYLTYRGRGGMIAAALVLLSPQLVSVRGMETAVMLAFVAATIWAATGRRDALAGLLLAALVVVRPDGVLLAPVLFGWRWARDGSPPWRLTLWAAIFGAVAGSAMLATIGTPSTLSAKVAQADSGHWDTFAAELVRLPSQAWLWWATVGVGVAVSRAWRAPALWFAVVFVLVYATLGVAGYPWYSAVPIYGAAVVAGLGFGRAKHLMPAVALAALSVVTLSPELPWWRQSYEPAGRWIAANTPPDALVASTELGMIGWYSQRPMVEPLGLLHPDLADEVAAGDFSSWVDVHRPDYWVTNAGMDHLEADALRAHGHDYRAVWRSGGLVIREHLPDG